MRRTAAALTLTPVIALAACAGGGEVETAAPEALDAVVVQAATDSVDAATGRFTMTTSMSMGGIGAFGMTADGVYDDDAGQASITIAFDGLDDLVGEVPDGAFGDLGGEWQMVLDGDTAYLDLGGLAGVLGADGWVSVPAGPEVAAANPMGPVGASEVLDLLGGVTEVTEVGDEEIDGVEVTHYAATLDPLALGAAEAEARGIDPAELDEALGLLESEGVTLGDSPIDVWVDGDGLVRRVTMGMSMGGGAMGDVSYEVTVDYHALGEPVEIAVPDPSEVTPIDPDELAGGN